MNNTDFDIWLEDSIDHSIDILSNPEYFKTIQKFDCGEVSDGYHTFEELYHYRMLYNAAMFNLLPRHIKVIKSRRHNDGELCFGSDNWFIVQAELPTGQISNHYHKYYWDLFKIPEVDKADPYDGHTPIEAAMRLENFLKEM